MSTTIAPRRSSTTRLQAGDSISVSGAGEASVALPDRQLTFVIGVEGLELGPYRDDAMVTMTTANGTLSFDLNTGGLPVSTLSVSAAPSQLGGALRWFSMASMSDTDAEVIAAWPDEIDGGAATASGSARPVLRTSVANAHKGMVFDGVDCVMTFSKATAVRTVICVMRYEAPFVDYAPLLGDDSEFGLSGPTAAEPGMLDPSTSGTMGGGGVRINGNAVVDPYSAPRPTSLSVVTVRTGAAVGLSNIAMDRISPRRTKGVYSEVALFDRVLSDAECDAVEAYFMSLYDIIATENATNVLGQILASGDSLMSGQGASAVSARVPNQVAAGLAGGAAAWTVTNVATSGMTAELLWAGVFYQTVPPSKSSVFKRWVLLIWAGTNDLFVGATAEQVYAYLCALWAMGRANGLPVIAATILPRTTPGQAGTFETERVALNTLIRSNATLYDALADVAANTTIGDQGDQDNLTYYNADKTHMTDAGYALVGDIFTTAVGSVL